jgi:hypothetical protein
VFAQPTAHTVTLTWDPVTTNTDGTPVTDLAGYKFYMRSSPIPDSGDKAALVATVLSTAIETTIDISLADFPDKAYLRAAAYDVSGNESALSNEVMIDLSVIDITVPMTLIIRFKVP